MTDRLYTFWRSSASYRVRIALNLKGLDYQSVPIHFRKEGGQHRKPEFLAKNPQGLVPVWEEGSKDEAATEKSWTLNQSLAIIEYLDETHPQCPLIPSAAKAKAEVRALSQIIACEIHPLNNLRVLNYLKQDLNLEQLQVDQWYRHWVQLGFETLEARFRKTAGQYSYGDSISMVDCCLAPQVYNAQRFGCEIAAYPRLAEIYARLTALDAFIQAAPEQQPDAE